MDNNQILEANHLLYLADEKIKQSLVKEAFNDLLDLKKNYPDFGPTYNHLGWIYTNSFNDYSEAEKNYQLALEKTPEYPATYINYAILLILLENFNKAKDLLNKGLKINGNNKGKIYNELGFICEMQGQFSEALDFYLNSLRWTITISDIDSIKNAIHRCRMKMSIMDEENSKKTTKA